MGFNFLQPLCQFQNTIIVPADHLRNWSKGGKLMDNSQSQKSLTYCKAIGNQKNQNESSRHKIQREKIKSETNI